MPYFIANFCHLSDGHDEVARVCSLYFSKEDYDNIGQFEGLRAVWCLKLEPYRVCLVSLTCTPVEKVAAASQRGGNEKGWRGEGWKRMVPKSWFMYPMFENREKYLLAI